MSWVTTITKGGYRLIIDSPGKVLKYTKAACSSQPTPQANVTDLTELAQYVMDMSIVDYGSNGVDVALLRTQLDNRTVTTPFNLYQIGIWAQLFDADNPSTPVSDEVLLQVVQDEETPDPIRSNPQVSEYLVNTVVGQAVSFEAVIDHAAYVSVGSFRDLRSSTEELKAAFESHRDGEQSHTASQITTGAVPGAPTVESALSLISTDYNQFVRDLAAEMVKYSNTDMPSVTNVKEALDSVSANKVNKTPPQKHSLVIADGLTGTGHYWKNGFNEVSLFFAVSKASGLAYGEIIGILPAGFRPSEQTTVLCYSAASGASRSAASNAYIHPDGKITITLDGYATYTSTTSIAGSAFIATQ